MSFEETEEINNAFIHADGPYVIARVKSRPIKELLQGSVYENLY